MLAQVDSIDSASALPASLLALCAEELRKRLPLLLQAVTLGDCVAAREEAHAMKGVAANFGLAALAERLGELEAAARAGEAPALCSRATGLRPQLDATLDRLLGMAA